MSPSPSSSSTESVPQGNASDIRLNWVVGILVFSSFVFCYAQVFVEMVGQWWAISMYSYAFLIPVISGYLAWTRREKVLALKPVPHYLGGAVLLLSGLSALIIGQVGGVRALQQVSLMVIMPGVVLFLFGKSVLKALWLPITFLWFMIPIWEIFTNSLHFPFQVFSANLGVMLLRITGIPVYQDGVFIHLPNITLEVARACSGVNYLIAVMATAIPLATIVLHDVWKRVALVAFAVAVAALANSLRVAAIGALSYYDLSGDLHGPYHTLHGVFVSMVGYVVIFGGLWILAKGQPQRDRRPSASTSSRNLWVMEWSQSRGSCAVLVAVFLLVGAFRYIDRSQSVPLRQSLSEFSVGVAGWSGRDIAPVEKIPGTDQSLSRIYRTDSGSEVQLLVSYFESQAQGKELISPSTAKLHAHAAKIKIHVGEPGEMEINQTVQEESAQGRRLVLFWYDLNGRIVAGQYAVKGYTAWDAIVHGRTNGAIIWLAADLASGDPQEKARALAMLTEFSANLYPALNNYLPHLAN